MPDFHIWTWVLFLLRFWATLSRFHCVSFGFYSEYNRPPLVSSRKTGLDLTLCLWRITVSAVCEMRNGRDGSRKIIVEMMEILRRRGVHVSVQVVSAEGLSGSYLFRVEKGWCECGYLGPVEQKGWHWSASIWQTLWTARFLKNKDLGLEHFNNKKPIRHLCKRWYHLSSWDRSLDFSRAVRSRNKNLGTQQHMHDLKNKTVWNLWM